MYGIVFLRPTVTALRAVRSYKINWFPQQFMLATLYFDSIHTEADFDVKSNYSSNLSFKRLLYVS